MPAAVHENLPKAVDVRFVQDEHVRGRDVRVVLHEAPWISARRARHAHRQAPGMGIPFRLPRLHECLCPGQQRNLGWLEFDRLPLEILDGAAAYPRAVQVHRAVRHSRHRAGGCVITAALGGGVGQCE